MFQLRFPPSEIAHWAQRYSYAEEDGRVERAGSAARERGYLRRSEFLALCRWKTPRTAKQCASNSPQRIREASELAFGTADERVKIGVLRLLAGVEWPTASVLLHFCDQGSYPILDFRALWSLGIRTPPVSNFEVWAAYTSYARQLADSTRITMRTLDRGLWQYSKEHQPARRLTSA